MPDDAAPATAPRDPGDDLRRIAFLLERGAEPTFRVKAFRRAAQAVAGTSAAELATLSGEGRLRELDGVGEVTARCITESLRGEEPVYLRRWEATGGRPVAEGGAELRAAIVGDCHTHSDWSDGGSPPLEMAEAARGLGHAWTVLTDHSPRLRVANGLSPERLRAQLDVVARVNEQLAPFRLLTGIECDINEDGTLDQEPELLAELDLVVVSVHSKLRMPREEMTRRMVAAVANPHADVLGHCTGRMVTARETRDGRATKPRPESEFDAEVVFAACRQFGVAVEVNSRPERLDPPKRLLRLAVEAGCLLAVDTDAHAPGQLDWQPYGCERAAACGADPDRVVTTWDADRLLAWTGDHTTG